MGKKKIAESTISKKNKKIAEANVTVKKYKNTKQLIGDEQISSKFIIEITLDQVIEPQMRPRISGFNFYDPLAKYKSILLEKIEDEIARKKIKFTVTDDMYFKVKLHIESIPPQGFTKKKRFFAVIKKLLHFNVKPDLDNCFKTFTDCVEKLIYKNDSQITNIEMSKEYGVNDKTVITFYAYEQPKVTGTFDEKILDSLSIDEDTKNFIKGVI